jgi:hypothetical protein
MAALFTQDQQNSINAFQASGVMHPFTCGNAGCREDLVAKEDGLHCPACGHCQTWCHSWMADWSWQDFGLPSAWKS